MSLSQKATGKKSIEDLDFDNIVDPAFIIQTSVELLKIRYEKYLDSTALEQLNRIERAAIKISSELSKLESK